MTEFRKKEFCALDEFQSRVEKYGLTVNRRSIGGIYVDDDCTQFSCHMTTEFLPVKGNKDLLDRLKNDGYYADIRWHLNQHGKRCKVFTIHGNAIIEL